MDYCIHSTDRLCHAISRIYKAVYIYIYIRLIALEEFVETNINPLGARFTATTPLACWLCLRSTPVEPHRFSLFAEILTESFRTGSSSPFCPPLLHPTWCKSRKSPRTYTHRHCCVSSPVIQVHSSCSVYNIYLYIYLSLVYGHMYRANKGWTIFRDEWWSELRKGYEPPRLGGIYIRIPLCSIRTYHRRRTRIE